MYSGKICHNSTTGGHINFILGANMRTTPNKWGTKRLLWQYRLPSNGATKSAFYDRIGVFITTSGSRDPIFGKIGQKSRLHGHIMYSVYS